MKKRFYLVRHGQKVKIPGDPPLSEMGLLQASRTGEYLKDFQIKKIEASPALRTRQTAEQINKSLNLEITPNPLLRERVNWGDNPNQDFETFLAMWNKGSKERDFKPEVGDSSHMAGERLDTSIKKETDETHEVLFVTHGGIITDFLRNIFSNETLNSKYENFTELLDKAILECSITTVEFDTENKNYELLEIASVQHLENLS